MTLIVDKKTVALFLKESHRFLEIVFASLSIWYNQEGPAY